MNNIQLIKTINIPAHKPELALTDVLKSSQLNLGGAMFVIVKMTKPTVITDVTEINKIRFQFQNPLLSAAA
ncbi:hypothetical protein FACS1894218_6350 [Bacilli bacterium]|nr:hypothetical protein FACS1894218_6350 [Bacilli bacterium]